MAAPKPTTKKRASPRRRRPKKSAAPPKTGQSRAPSRRGRAIPRYERRKLSLGAVLVKILPRQAKNEHIICQAFQKQGWPERIDNPLPRVDGIGSRKRRRRDAIARLNQRQIERLIRFRAVDDGGGILWERVKK
jgi:hypothetical protein